MSPLSAIKAALGKAAAQHGWNLHEEHISNLDLFVDSLLEANKKLNLVSSRAAVHITDHVLDSLSFLDCGLLDRDCQVADIGSGAGLPGLVLAIARPEASFYLIESHAGKARFLSDTIASIGINNIRVINDRVETLAHLPEYREKFDIVTARAVAGLAVLLEYGLPLLKTNGHLVAAKGAKARLEVREAEAAAQILGGELGDFVSVGYDGLSEKQLVVYRKVTMTPDKYPRRPGMPSKRPIGGGNEQH